MQPITLHWIDNEFTVCRLTNPLPDLNFSDVFFFARSDEEISLVCASDQVPADCVDRSDGWIAMRVQGVLDFSLTGILSRLSTVLADARIPIFAVSTYNTDYILISKTHQDRATRAFLQAGYRFDTQIPSTDN